jgi:uncharacterized protein
MSKDQILEIVHQYVQSLRAENIPITSVYLFGSYAKGEQNKSSDIDIGVVSKSFGNDRIKKRVMLMKIGDKINMDIEPHPFSPEDFADEWNLLAREIKRTGIKIL